MALDSNITVSILPHSPHNRAIANDAHKQGIEIMLHLPMEPIEYPSVDPGPGALLSEMNPDELVRRYRALGGQATLVVAEGQGHSMWEGFFRCSGLVDFVVASSTEV